MGITNFISQKIAGTRFADLPTEVVEKAKDLIIDFLGVTVAGAKTGALLVQVLTESVCNMGGTEESKVIGRRFKVPCVHAAMLNSLAAEILEFSDGDNAIIAHPGQVVIPSALAIAEKQKSGGKDLISSIVAGYEAMYRIGLLTIPEAMRERGFAPSGILGSFGAAAAACRILKLPPERIQHAIGLAATVTGFREPWVITGTMDKDIMVCEATRRGLWAAMLASKGLTGANSILEGSEGFVRAMIGHIPVQETCGWADGHYSILDTYLKKYPSCRHTHSTIDAVLNLVNAYDIKPANIAYVTVTVDSLSAKISIAEPNSDTGARFSHQFAVAVAISRGRATISDFTADVAQQPEIRDLMKKVKVIVDHDMDKEWPEKWASEVEVELVDGRIFKKRVDYPSGDKNNPLGMEEVIEKFEFLTSHTLDANIRRDIIKMVYRIEELQDITNLMDFL